MYLAFVAGPAIAGIWISLHSWRGAGDPMRWVGLANYRRLWADDIFRTAFLNSLTILAVCGVAVFALAFVLTMALREMRARSLLRSLLFFPYIVSPIAIGVALGLLLDPRGLANATLCSVGLDSLAQPWLAPDRLFSTILVGIVWVSSGFYVVILMAGMDRIPAYFYEDADLAGATPLQKFRHVTLPLSWDVVSVAAVLWVINSLKIFEFIYAFTGTGDSPAPDTRTLPRRCCGCGSSSGCASWCTASSSGCRTARRSSTPTSGWSTQPGGRPAVLVDEHRRPRDREHAHRHAGRQRVPLHLRQRAAPHPGAGRRRDRRDLPGSPRTGRRLLLRPR
ncbi:carbohydrate ABC transporter permease [Dactylosporangium cerinum]